MPERVNALREKRLLADAAAGVYDRLRAEEDEAPEEIRPAFSYMRRNLFRLSFSRQAMAAACPAAGSAFPRLFREATGETPAFYGRRRRLEVVERLLEASDLTIRRIARRVGYGSERGLRLAFTSWKGVSPAAWRAGVRVPEASFSEPREVERHATWRRALAGGAEAEALTELLDEVLELYPQLQERRAPGLGSGRKGWTVPGSPAFQRLYEELKVERVVAVLGRPDVRPGTRRRLVEEVPMASYALVDRLLAESARLEGEDPERSAELSRLALHGLEACRRRRLPGLRERKVLALARRARTAHAAGEVVDAEEALALLELTDAAVVARLEASVRVEFLEARSLSRRLALEKAVDEAEQAGRLLAGEADAESALGRL